MKLDAILHNLDIEGIQGEKAIRVAGITHDSRKVEKDFLFVAVDGFRHKGTEFVQDAVSKGAAAVVSSIPALKDYPSVTWVTVKNPRRALSRVAANFCGNPTEKMKVVGVTGTSGKTTCCYIIDSVFMSAGIAGGLMGTIEVRTGGGSIRSKLTTPEATDIHAAAREMHRSGVEMLVMEVSSHSLKLQRVDDVDFDIAVFTNLGQDHLDFHGDLDDYAGSKSILFSKLLKAGEGKGAVVNDMDSRTDEITKGYGGRFIRFSFEDRAGSDIAPLSYKATLEGLRAKLRTPWGRMDIYSPLLGRHNLMNIMASAGVGLLAGIEKDRVEEGIANLEKVPGRMESVAGGGGRMVVIDYSHTPDSLKAAIDSLSSLSRGRIITVFGAGGDRERQKRPLMGKAACEKSDVCVVTSDNPRTEDPEKIIEMIVEGLEEGGFRKAREEIRRGTYVVIPDRKEAINFAIRNSQPDDVILVAGKGHEDYQIFRERVIHFDDREVVIEALGKSGLGLH